MKETNIEYKFENKKLRKKISEGDFRNRNRKYFAVAFAIGLGLLIGMLITWIFGSHHNPFMFFIYLWTGTFASIYSFGVFLSTFTWLVLVGLAVAIAFRAGWFNIGVASQMILGGAFAWMWAYSVDIGRIGMFGTIFIGIFVGVGIAAFITWLKLEFGIHEVVSSIMLNWIAFWFIRFLQDPSINAPWSSELLSDGSLPMINPDNSLAAPWLSNLFGGAAVTYGIFLSIIAIIFCWWIFKYSTFGYSIDVIGKNKDAAQYAGISVKANLYGVMMISGGLAGLAGAIYYCGELEYIPFLRDEVIPTQAFDGIAVALIGMLNPIGVVFSSMLIALLYAANFGFSSEFGNPYLKDVITASIMIFIACISYIEINDGKLKRKQHKVEKYKSSLIKFNNSYQNNEQISDFYFDQSFSTLNKKLKTNIWIARMNSLPIEIEYYTLQFDKLIDIGNNFSTIRTNKELEAEFIQLIDKVCYPEKYIKSDFDKDLIIDQSEEQIETETKIVNKKTKRGTK